MFFMLLARLLIVFVAYSFTGAAFSADHDSFIVARSGQLPILLTVPHGGSANVPGVPTRSNGTTSTDLYTIELMEALVKHLQEQLGSQPYLVAARFSRKYIDANRVAAEAFDSGNAKPAYDAYHNQIQLFISQIKARFPRGALLLDIHGQSEDPSVLHRGTRNGSTVTALLRNHGLAALTGSNSILGIVQRKGYTVFPPNTPPNRPAEDRRFNGGYTVQTYGSASPEGIDAIQFEIGRNLRTDSQFIAGLAEAIVIFYKTYLASQLPQ